jgi:hypothetical protein
MTFDQFFEHVKGLVAREGRRMRDPDDDWRMTIAADFHDQEPHDFQPPEFMYADFDMRSRLGMALATAALITRPTKVGMSMSTWMVSSDEDPTISETNQPRPSTHPKRFEAVFIVVLDAEVTRSAIARIHRRRRRPPVLGPWEEHPRGTELESHLADPLREALR